MRRTLSAFVSLGLMGIAAGLVGASCIDPAGDCALINTCTNISGGAGPTSSSSSTGTGGMNPACAGDPSAKNTTEECGVFVQANALGPKDAEDGTLSHPYTSLQTAVNKAGGKRVYACGSAPYAESVTVAAAMEVYGGFDCGNDWTWTAGARSTIQSAAGKVALTLKKQGDGAKVQGFVLTAASAMNKGDSSIAVVVDDMAAELKDCEVKAGDGVMGEDGVTPSGTATKGTDAPPPDAATMNACIAPAGVAGGVPGMLTCDEGMTAGGLGGLGGITGTMNGDGAKGADGTLAAGVNGKGGTGQDMTNLCAKGTDGTPGTNGVVGAAGTLPGALSLVGISDTDMTDGQPGTRGNGGGGGGGAKAGMFCGGGSTDGPGASGGGGGAGGCGGKGGGGGKAGGSSLGILSLGMKLVLREVTVTTGKGGDGGKGVGGQGGGLAGLGAVGGAPSGMAGSKAGCAGGSGGAGGDGGSGAGGRGGHSIGLAYANGPSNAPALKGFTGAAMGAGGAPGPLNAMGKGAPGAMGACWDFSKNAACSQ